MSYFQVIEEEEGIQDRILRGLRGRPRGGNAPEHPALLVVSPRAAARGRDLPRSCRTALVPGEMGERCRVRAASAVSYGPSPRDSLTVSSREGDRLWVALQGEVVTVEAMVVERQEFPVTLPPGEEPLPVLAAAGALLLLGVPPEEVDQSLSR